MMNLETLKQVIESDDIKFINECSNHLNAEICEVARKNGAQIPDNVDIVKRSAINLKDDLFQVDNYDEINYIIENKLINKEFTASQNSLYSQCFSSIDVANKYLEYVREFIETTFETGEFIVLPPLLVTIKYEEPQTIAFYTNINDPITFIITTNQVAIPITRNYEHFVKLLQKYKFYSLTGEMSFQEFKSLIKKQSQAE